MRNHWRDVLLGLAHEPVLAHPRAQATEEAEVRLDGGRRELLALSDLDHRMDVLLPQVARIGCLPEARLLRFSGLDDALFALSGDKIPVVLADIRDFFPEAS